jgi:hypothetical protein
VAIALNPAFPAPDRSRQTVHRSRDEDGVVDIRWCDGVMSDGRPFRAELWAQDGVTMLTFFFSSDGIAAVDKDHLGKLVVDEGLVSFKPDGRRMIEARPIADDAGSQMWSVNVVVGDEDESHLAGSAPLWPYRSDREPDTMFRSGGVPAPTPARG